MMLVNDETDLEFLLMIGKENLLRFQNYGWFEDV